MICCSSNNTRAHLRIIDEEERKINWLLVLTSNYCSVERRDIFKSEDNKIIDVINLFLLNEEFSCSNVSVIKMFETHNGRCKRKWKILV